MWDTKVASLLLKLVVIVRSGSKSNAGAIIVPAKKKVEGRTDGLPLSPMISSGHILKFQPSKIKLPTFELQPNRD